MAKENDHWSEEVKTHPVKNQNIFNESVHSIVRYFADPRVSPEGLGQAIKKLVFYVNRAGTHGNPAHIQKVQDAIAILKGMEHRKKLDDDKHASKTHGTSHEAKASVTHEPHPDPAYYWNTLASIIRR